ncbi:DgyrCDS8898 [Dimorphilus gyrociliatus]|uniref:DgyrCDS8898 n=1 Tax=Dimorphilus gyrociliatus TaxID=2664684 RepID=A0A7I8VVF0_9ANNE|nr:DgyrCDS8898 [Dimorphilus gyrociliatus]
MSLTKFIITIGLLASSIDDCQGKRGLIKECKVSDVGFDYQGKEFRKTTSGRDCQRWDSQEPHPHDYTAEDFPEYSLKEASNYCRNPEEEEDGPWCFTQDPDVEWEICSVPKCHDKPECRFTEKAVEYKGSLSKSWDGTDCLFWNELSTSIEGVNEKDKNFCRNPNGMWEGPGCYVAENVWRLCEIEYCKPATQCKRTQTGAEYSGSLAVTKSGRPCQRWDTQAPHNHSFNNPEQFPEETLSEVSNFCRNPDNSPDGPWCLTLDPDIIRESCHIPICDNCAPKQQPRAYFGNKKTTSTGKDCRLWSLHYNESESTRFPDSSVKSAENFCRNPTNNGNGPWCFIDADGSTESCNINTCKSSAVVKHILHIGLDGFKLDCVPPTKYPNLNNLKKTASWTYTKARTTILASSAPGWSEALCGMSPERTGILYNAWLPPWQGMITSIPVTPTSGADYPIPCAFRVLREHDEYIQTGALYGWEWIKNIAGTGMPGTMHKDEFCKPQGIICDRNITETLKEYIPEIVKASERSYTFAHLDSLDGAGHSHSWCSDQYFDAIEEIDKLVGELLSILSDEVLLIINSDHGGVGTDHGNYFDDTIQVPLFFRGPGIKRDYEMKASARNRDILPTVAHLLGIQANPHWDGRLLKEILDL